jgi:ribulose-bisphosphate carboxylase large chain
MFITMVNLLISMATKLNYVDLKYKPTTSDLICTFKVKPARGLTMTKAAGTVALESSIGTWTSLSTMEDRIAKTLKPSVFSIKKDIVKIAYPQELFEPGNMPQIFSSIAGNIFGMKAIDRLRLQDIELSPKLIKSFPGPAHGVPGVRKLTKVKNRPLVGTIVKPKLGLTAKEHAKVAYNAWVGGLDIVKDDENLSSMSFNKFEERVRRTLKLRDKAERETGEKKVYFANVTAETSTMLKRAELVKSLGGEYVMIDVLTAGWSAVQTLRKTGMFIHGHRAMHGAIDRIPDHGISMLVLTQACRFMGVDNLHIGTAGIGKMHGFAKEELAFKEACLEKIPGIKPMVPVASGGLSPLMMPKLVRVMGKDIVAQMGGGCHGHPDGTVKGATAIRQATDAALKGIPLKQYAKTHKELARAIEKWG